MGMRDSVATHEHCWELIPWLVNGTASEADQQAVNAHVTRCDECREELRRQRALHSHMQTPAEIGLDALASWEKLEERLDGSDAVSVEVLPPAAARDRRPWLWMAVAAQAVAIVVLLGFVLAPNMSAEGPYRTLSSPSATAPARADVRVVFAAQATVEEVHALLRRVNAEVIAGPSEAGVYSLAIERGSIANALDALRSDTAVVFAEPTK